MNENELKVYRQFFADVVRCASRALDACEEYDLTQALDHLQSGQFWMDTFKNRLNVKLDEDKQSH